MRAALMSEPQGHSDLGRVTFQTEVSLLLNINSLDLKVLWI